MTSWADFENTAPGFAARVRQLFSSHRHHTMATLRRDGSPRISGTEVEFAAGDIRVGMMAGTRRAGDLRRDGRVAIHSHTVDPPPAGGDPGSWCGDAKISGTAHEVARSDGDGGTDRFRVDIREVVLTRVGTAGDHLVIEVWRPGAGLVRIERR